MSYLKISSNNINSIQKCPTSKSYANRALIIAALKKEAFTLYDIPESKDVLELIEILKEIGLDISVTNNEVTILNSFPECEIKSNGEILLSSTEGGTTLRFVMALLSLGENTYSIPLRGKLSKRPMGEFIKAFSELGCMVNLENDTLKIKGKASFTNKEIKIDCSKTTQFASAFYLLKCAKEFNLTCENLESSIAYFEMTKKLVLELKEMNTYTVPADFSSLGYFISYALLKQKLIITNVNKRDKYQADDYFFELLDQMNAKYSLSENGLEVNPLQDKRGFIADGSKCIDLVPTLMFLASFLDEKSEIKNIKNLRYKECDRLEEMSSLLAKFSVKYEYDKIADIFKIYPDKDNLASVHELNMAFDHRMVMAASLFLKLQKGGQVAPISCISKSFPKFSEVFK